MKVKIIKLMGRKKEFKVEVSQGVQHFTLSPVGLPELEARWFARMFRKALKKHDDERITKSNEASR